MIYGVAGQGAAWPGDAGPGLARHGKGANGAEDSMTNDNFDHGKVWRGMARRGGARQGEARPGPAWHGTARAPMAHVFFYLALLAGCREQSKPAAPPAPAARVTGVARAAPPSRLPPRVVRPRVAAMSPAAPDRLDVASIEDMRPIDDAYELAIASPGDSEALHAYLDEVERMIAEAQ